MSGKPGPLNLITDVPGLKVGNAADENVRSGVTVILPDTRAPASVDVRGGGPGTRETDLLRPEAAAEAVDAIVLSGGSAYGLDAAGGVMSWLAARRRGVSLRDSIIPIVPAAILFDLQNGGDKSWGPAADSDPAREPPYRKLGIQACDAAAGGDFPLGNVGAGYGAAAGKIKGGLGSASWVEEDGLVVAALMAVNPVGSVLTPGNKAFWAAAFEQNGEFGNLGPAVADGALALGIPAEARIGGHTCIGIVATNAALDKRDLRRVAIIAQDGIARAIRPVHTPFDGDALFALGTGTWQDSASNADRHWQVARIGSIAADCVARAIARGVWHGRSLGPWPSLQSLLGSNN